MAALVAACSSSDHEPSLDATASSRSRSDAASADAGTSGFDSSVRDAARSDDDATMTQAASQPSSWDGRADLPDLAWTIPDCAVAHGVLSRNVLTPEQAPNPSLKLLAAALSGKRLALSFHDKFEAWGELHGDALTRFPSQLSGTHQATGKQSMVPVSPRRVALAPERALGLSFAPLDTRALLVEQTGTDQTTHALDAVPFDDGTLFLIPDYDVRDYGWASLAPRSDGSVAIVGRWNQSGGSGGRDGVARVTLDAARNVLGSPEWYDVPSDPKFSVAPALQAYLTGESVSVAVFAWALAGTLEIVIHPADGEARNVRLELRDPLDRGMHSVTAAIDGDKLACGWFAGIRDQDYGVEVTAEVSLADGAVATPPGPIGAPLHGDNGLVYLSHPVGGVDVIKYGDSAPGYRYDKLYARDNPLAIYLARSRPLRYEEVEPLRLGAGATVVDAIATRDGDRVAIFWRERGPATSELASEANVIQGVYYAVLACDG
jgi:hypothetical protein